MMRRLRVGGALLLLFCGLAAPSFAEQAVPPLRGHVTDLANTLDAGQRVSLERTLAAFEAQRGAQIAVLIVPSTAPESIEQYSIRAVEQWQLGREKFDDGVLLLVARDDRALRIEDLVGQERLASDQSIIDDIIVPHFKRDDYAGGIAAGVQQLMRLIEGEALPAPPRSALSAAEAEESLPFLFVAAFIGGMLLRSVFGRLTGAGLTGAGTGLLAWWLVGSLIFGLMAGLFAFFFFLGGGGRPPGRGGWGSSSTGGWGSGGFRGGGGGFGGGGASGRW